MGLLADRSITTAHGWYRLHRLPADLMKLWLKAWCAYKISTFLSCWDTIRASHDHYGVSNHRQFKCLLNKVLRLKQIKLQTLHYWSLVRRQWQVNSLHKCRNRIHVPMSLCEWIAFKLQSCIPLLMDICWSTSSSPELYRFALLSQLFSCNMIC